MLLQDLPENFFPQREVLQLGAELFSPGVHRKVILAAAHTKSFASAELVLAVVGEVSISGRHVGRMANKIGQQLLEEQQQRADWHQARPLEIEVENPPELAVVETDGGRIRTRQPDQGPGTHDPAWKESKHALFLRMASERHADDPCPELPHSLQNRNRLGQLVLEMSGSAAGAEEEFEDAASDWCGVRDEGRVDCCALV